MLVGGNLSNQLTDELLRKMISQWSCDRTQNSRFASGLLADNVADQLFDDEGDEWYLLDSRTASNPSDRDLVTRI